jgi:hypothetical protein
MFGMSKDLGDQNPKNWIFETTLFFVLFLSLQDVWYLHGCVG